MKRTEIQPLQHRYGIWDGEEEDAIRFVWELICLKVDKTKEEYPYATKTIDNLEKAEHIVFDLLDDISNIEEDAE